jgi:hypothetical protein
VQEYVGGEPTMKEQQLMAAQFAAQMRYELPIKSASIAWSLISFVAALGLLRRKNWARLLFIVLMLGGVLGIVSCILLFASLRLVKTPDVVGSMVIVLALGFVAWKLRSPSIADEFRNELS